MAKVYTIETIDASSVKVIITTTQGANERIEKCTCTNQEAIDFLTKHKTDWEKSQDDLISKRAQLNVLESEINGILSDINGFLLNL